MLYSFIFATTKPNFYVCQPLGLNEDTEDKTGKPSLACSYPFIYQSCHSNKPDSKDLFLCLIRANK
jgi:hypothetical protein